nr:RNA-dependent RNA polymerase [Partitiviridae sp.]
MAKRYTPPSARANETVVRIPPAKGFAFDLSPSREDPLARRAAEHVFGKTYVDDCFSRLHRSQLSYDALVDDLMGYQRQHARACRDDPVYQMAYQSIRLDLQAKSKLIPYTIGAVPKLADFPRAKSPGLPWKNEGFHTKGEVVDSDENVRAINVLWHHIGAGIKHDPLPDTCLFARSQVCSVEKEKIRGVWGYPLAVYMEEARFFYPIMDHLKGSGHKFPIGYGFEIGKGGMVGLSDMVLRHPESKCLMTDWSQFDKSVPAWLIRDAFSLLAELIDFDHVLDSEGLVWPVRAVRSRRRWKKLVDYFVETPVRTCKGDRFLVRAGVPSGSCFTNIIDTIINCLVSRYLCYQTIGRFPLGEMYLGDDGVVVLPSDSVVNLDAMADLALLKFGFSLSRDKSFVTTNAENIHFLGYHNRPLGMPNRDQSLLIVSFVHPERTRRTAEECAAAALGQLWANFDPRLATMWYRVLVFVADAFLVSFDEVLVQLKRTAHRHKYLSHIGRNFNTLTVPRPDEFDNILDVLPSPVPSRLPPSSRRYDYGELAREAWLFWSSVSEDDVDNPG